MSRDIVERLNDPVARAAWANAEMFEEAADEIIRLRAEFAAEKRKHAECRCERAAAEAERDALRVAISNAVEDLVTIELEQEIYAAQGVRMELAAALKGDGE